MFENNNKAVVFIANTKLKTKLFDRPSQKITLETKRF